MEIKSLQNTSFDTIARAFALAFADYEVQFSAVQLERMLKRRGFNPALSFAAFEQDEMVAFTLNGTGFFRSVPTAYDTGTGTIKEYRGQGLATRIFEYSLPYLKEANIQQYLLEVLQHNSKAISVYSQIGFTTTREFHYFIQKNEEIRLQQKSNPAVSITPVPIETLVTYSGMGDFHPSWQNSFESVQRAQEEFVYLGAFMKDVLVGYAVFEPFSGDITQLTVHNQHRRKGVGTLLLKELFKQNQHESIKLINVDINCHSLTGFLLAQNIPASGKQFEMIKTI